MWTRGMAGLSLVAMLLAGSLAGCGDGLDLDDDAAWRTSSDPVERSGLTWAMGSTVHFSDGLTIDTNNTIEAFVVAGDGVFFVPSDGSDDSAYFRNAALFFARPGGDAVDTGLKVSREGLLASPDGQHLVILNADYDAGTAVMRFFDLPSGEAYMSKDGMKPDPTDPQYLLNESEVAILGIDDERVYARGLHGDVAYDLGTGKGRGYQDSGDVLGFARSPLVSPDDTWRIEQMKARTDRVVNTAGDRVLPDAGTDRWDLEFWADDTTVVGRIVEGSGAGSEPDPGDSMALMTCVVPSGDCEVFEETTGRDVIFPMGLSDFYGMGFPDGSGD